MNLKERKRSLSLLFYVVNGLLSRNMGRGLCKKEQLEFGDVKLDDPHQSLRMKPVSDTLTSFILRGVRVSKNERRQHALTSFILRGESIKNERCV